MNNRRQAEDTDMEQGQGDRTDFRQRRNRQRLLGREASRKPPQSPEQRSSLPVQGQAPPQGKPQLISRTPSPVQPGQPSLQTNQPPAKPRVPQGTPSQSPKVARGGWRRTPVEAQPPQRSKPLTANNLQQDASRARLGSATPAVSAGASGSKRPRQSPGLAQSKRTRLSRRSPKRPLSPFVHIVRLLILGVGIGAIVGTLLSALNPSTQASDQVKETPKAQVKESPSETKPLSPFALSQEISVLKTEVQTLVSEHPTLQPGVFLVDLDTGAYLDWQGATTFASASTIKVPILVAFFQDVDAGKIRLDEPLTIQPDMMAEGSGDLQYKPVGTQYMALEVATKMIAISDNTATNMLIARLGGAEALNARFRSWGLTATTINSALPDIAGTNTTSPRDLGSLMSLVNQGELVSLRSRDRLLDIMQRTQTNSLLPQGLGTGATIAHKTGTIGSLLADVGLVDMPTGKRYLVAVMVKRPHNDASAEEFIRQVSRTVYNYFNEPRATPSTTSMPSGSTATISRVMTSQDVIN